MGGKIVNKAELIEALAGRLGDRKSATAALDAVLAEIQGAVTKGDKVSITGFGVFEKRVRAARTARNPRTGESVKVKKTSVPAFRAGAGFKDMVAAGKVPKVAKAAASVKKATTKATAAKAAATKTTARPATKTAAKTTAAKATKTAATKAAPTKRATKAAATATPRRTATVRTAAAKTAAKSTAAKSTTSRTTAVKATRARKA